jgi:sigma-B regulation protein RsbU (phosphoserine phosphatase)
MPSAATLPEAFSGETLRPDPAPPGDASRAGRQLEDVVAIYKGLVEVSALINAITDFSELLTEILEVARRVMRAEGSALILLNERTNQLELVVARSPKGEVVKAHQVIPKQSIAGWVFENGVSLLVPDAYKDPRFYPAVDKKTGVRTRSILCVPLRRRGKPIGVLQVINSIGEDRPSFDATDMEAFEAYSNLAATAIDKLRFLEEQRRRARFEQEMSIATEIQKSFLPRTLPVRPDLSFASHYRPALDIGGDFYDLFEVDPDEIYFVIGDVAGKGIPAALLMAQSLSALRLIISRSISPAEAMERWNRTLCRQSTRGLFITATLGRITPSRRLVEVVSAGHCPPWIAHSRKGDGPMVKEAALEVAPPLAILPAARYKPSFLTLEPGQWLVFYTDGLTESHREGEDVLLGGEGARGLLEKEFANPRQVVATLSNGESAYRGDSSPQDDLTLLVFGFPDE